MLIVYDRITGEILDNTGTNSAQPEGPPDEEALVNVPAARRSAVALLRLHDELDAPAVQQVFTQRHHVDPSTGRLVLDGPHPAPPAPVASPSLADRLAAVEARLDKAANVTVTGDAAKLRDNLR